MSRRIGIVGCRPPRGQDVVERATFNRIVDAVWDFVRALPDDVIVVSGGANGVDTEATVLARRRGIVVVEHFPDYITYPPHLAPLQRNTVIVSDVDELHAWPAPWSRGTHDTIRKARARGIPVAVHEVSR